jgi:hypothetical protein
MLKKGGGKGDQVGRERKRIGIDKEKERNVKEN